MTAFIRRKFTRRTTARPIADGRDLSAVDMQRFESTRAALDRAVRRVDADAA